MSRLGASLGAVLVAAVWLAAPPPSAHAASAKRLIARAGADRVVVVGQRVRLSGKRTKGLRSGGRLRFSWRVIRAPKRAGRRLTGASSATPVFTPTKVGVYVLRLTARQRGARRGSDLIVLRAGPDTAPIGIPISTIDSSNGTVRIGKVSYNPIGRVRVTVIDRGTLQVRERSYGRDPDFYSVIEKFLNDLSDDSLVIITAPQGLDAPSYAAGQEFNRRVVQTIGGEPLDANKLARAIPFTVIGVHGWARGTAYDNVGRQQLDPDRGEARMGSILGYLQRNPSTQAFGFASGDFVSFSTGPQSGDPPGENTMLVGGAGYRGVLPPGQSGFHLVELDAASLRRLRSFTFATNGGPDDAGRTASLARLMSNADGNEIVLLQSIGTPKPTNLAWNDLATEIGRLGGTRHVLFSLDGTQRYALIGNTEQRDRTVESVTDATSDQAGRLAGLLARARDSRFYALLSDPAARTVGNPFLETAYQEATPWPDRDTAGQRAAIAYIAGQLDLKVADPLERYRDLDVDFGGSAYYGRLDRMDYPGSADFTAEDFTTVKAELLSEFLWVSKLRSFTSRLKDTVFQSAVISKGELETVVKHIQDNIPDDGGGPINAFDIYGQLFGLAGSLGVPGGGGVAGVFKIAGALTKKNGQDLVGELNAASGEMAEQIHKRLEESLTSIELMRSIYATDYGKLRTAGESIDNRRPGWVLNDDNVAILRRSLLIAAKRVFYGALLRIPYQTYYLGDRWQPVSECRVLRNEPASAWFPLVTRLVANGSGVRPVTQTWAIGRRREHDVSSGMIANSVLTDALFKKIPADTQSEGLGLYKPYFLTRTLPFGFLPEVNCRQR